MNTLVPFHIPSLGDEEISEVIDTLRSGWLTTGLKTRRFEQEFSSFIGEGIEAIAVNSATAGMHLVLEALGVRTDDEVITTPYTFTATAEVICYLGAVPVFVDIDPKTINIDPGKLEDVIIERIKTRGKPPKAIIPVHIAGLACDMGLILSIARKYDIKVMEDAAHALPTTWSGRLVGSLESDATVYSFYANKTITTGEGGMVVTRNQDIAGRCKIMRLHGINRDVHDRFNSGRPWYYEVIAPGFKYNMNDIAASIGIHQLRKVWSSHKQRQAIATYYDEAFSKLPIVLPSHAFHDDIHSWHLYMIRLKPSAPVSRDRFLELMAAKGIGCSVHFIPLHIQPYWCTRFKLKPKDFPNALQAYFSTVSLPIYDRMTTEDVERVILAIQEILG